MNMKKKKSIPNIEEYKKARRETGAVKLTFDLIQIARKISHLEEDEMILTLYDLANDKCRSLANGDYTQICVSSTIIALLPRHHPQSAR